ncbi:hypothetical protein AHT88_17785 [Salmonella enterica subsp. enterica serovar Muenchen]|nr:hypothetical protein [Salmonella enterica subsp. enterica serovar Muenchen]
MNKFEYIEHIASGLIFHTFETDLKGVPSKVYYMILDDKEFGVFTPLKESDPEVMMFCASKERSERINAHYMVIFECECTLKAVLSRLGSDECLCPECLKEQERAKRNSNKRKKHSRRKKRK